MPPRQSGGSLPQVLVPATPARIEDTPALEISRRNRKPALSAFTERIVYTKPNRDRGGSRRSERANTSFSDVEDEITEMRIKSEPSHSCIGPGVGVHMPRDNILEEDNSLPLTKLQYKLENHELVREQSGKHSGLSRLKIGSNPVRVSDISKGKTGRSSEREILSCKAESGFVKVSNQSGDNKASSRGEEKMRRKSPRKVKEIGEIVVGRTNLRARTSDLSELPLSHVKQMRQKIKKSTLLKSKKLKHLFVNKKLNGKLTTKPPTAEMRGRLRERKTEGLPDPASTPLFEPELSCLSLTVFDADVARPSRPIHRPVRYLDSLNQNAENIEIKKLSLVDKFDLPYDRESLCWNRSHSKNKQVKRSKTSPLFLLFFYDPLSSQLFLLKFYPLFWLKVPVKYSWSINLRYFLLVIVVVVAEHLLLLWWARQLAREDGSLCPVQPVVPREVSRPPAIHHARHTRGLCLAVRLQPLQLRLGVPEEDGHDLGRLSAFSSL